MITTSKLNNSIVSSRAIFWELRAEEMGAKGQGRGTQTPEIKNDFKGVKLGLITL